MLRAYTFFFLITVLLSVGCRRTDLEEVKRRQQQEESRIAALETAVKSINAGISSLKDITAALQQNIPVKSHTATDSSYLLTMSNGTTISITKGKDGAAGKDGLNGTDGVNTPVIGVKENTDGWYYWTIGGDFILQDGQKLRVIGSDGVKGKDAVTPRFRVTDNQWMASYDGGNAWVIVKDGAGNPVAATVRKVPAGITNFSITDRGDFIDVTYMEVTYPLAKAKWQIAAGILHSLLLSPDGNLYGTGDNTYGQLGINGGISSTPVFIMGGVKAVAAGGMHTLVLKHDGTVWAVGYNAEGELGNGATANTKTFSQVATNAIAIYAGFLNSFIIKTDRTLWATGDNEFGQLGLGNTTNLNVFTQVTDNVQTVGAAYGHTLILKMDGSLYAAGKNNLSQLGLNDGLNRTTPTLITNNVMAVAAGNHAYSMILKKDSTVWATGYNYFGQLGTGNNTDSDHFIQVADHVKVISIGEMHSAILKNDQTLWITGYNTYGVFGIGNTNSSNLFIKVASGVQSVEAGFQFTLILKNGKFLSSGQNNFGQLGIGTRSDVHVFTDLPVFW